MKKKTRWKKIEPLINRKYFSMCFSSSSQVSFSFLPFYMRWKKRHQLKKRIFNVLILIISKKNRESTTSMLATRHLSLLFEMRKFIWHIWSDASKASIDRVSGGGEEWCTSYNNNHKRRENIFLISRCSNFEFSFVYFIAFSLNSSCFKQI